MSQMLNHSAHAGYGFLYNRDARRTWCRPEDHGLKISLQLKAELCRSLRHVWERLPEDLQKIIHSDEFFLLIKSLELVVVDVGETYSRCTLQVGEKG